MGEKRRPDIEAITDHTVFAEWYWLKSELVDYCRKEGLKTSGSKADLTQRIYDFKAGTLREETRSKPRAKEPDGFDWHRDEICADTPITSNYKNTQNVRRYLKTAIGSRFKFNREFMDWMWANAGKTMGDAANQWLHIEQKRKQGIRSATPDSNQFNRFVRDYFDADPAATMDQARTLWKQVRDQPGSNRYADTIGRTKAKKLAAP